jgi:3'-5' exoribonuclease
MPQTPLVKILGSTVPIEAELRVQIIEHEQKETRDLKPYVRMKISDGGATADMSVWSDSPSYVWAKTMLKGDCYALNGAFSASKFGIESKGWTSRLLEGDERAAVFAGPPELAEKQEVDWQRLWCLVNNLPEGPLKLVTVILLEELAEPYRRAGAARGNHHARRGGLVEHVSLMAQCGNVLCDVYPELRKDLVIAAIVFHDVGKLFENQYEKEGFEMPFSFRAEAYGHIVIGIEMARNFWRKLDPGVQHENEILLHALCHCIASHHGCLEWGSPVEPKMPEAQLVHFIDNIDAKLEMFRQQRKTAKELATGVFEGQRPLPKSLLFI